MADVNIGAKLQVDTGTSFQNIGQLRDYIKTTKGELDKLEYGTDEYAKAQQRLSKATSVLNGTNQQQATGIGKVTDSLKSSIPGFAGASEGASTFTGTLKALALTPVGIVILAIAAAVALIKNAMDRSEESSNKLKVAFAAFSGIVSGLLKFLEPLGKFLIDGIVKGFELAAKAAQGAIKLISSGLSLIGFDSAAKSVAKFGKDMEDAAKNGIKLAKAEAELDQAQRKARITQLQYQKDAEKLRQIRDDQTKSISERIAANTQLGVVLKKQMQEELSLAQVALKLANIRIEQEGRTKEALDAQAEALTNIVDIQERLTGQESEQLANRSSLIKEDNDNRINAAKEAEEKRKAAVEKQRAFDERLLKLKHDNELAAIKDQTQKKLKEQEFSLGEERKAIANDFNDQKINKEQRNQLLAELEKSNRTKILEIQAEAYNEEVKKRKAAFDEAERARIEYNNRILAEEEARAAKVRESTFLDSDKRLKELAGKFDLQRQELDAKQAITDFYYQQDLLAAGDNAEKKRAIEQKHTEDTAALTNARIAISKTEADTKAANASAVGNALSALSDVVGKQTVAGKALAVASSMINTFQGITASLAKGGVAGIAQAVATGIAGFAAVKNIISTKIPGQSGGGSTPSAPSIASAPLTPQAMLSTTQLDQGSINGIGNAGMGRAFVVESDITGNQERIRRLNLGARLG